MKKNLIIIGGSGLIGSQLIRYFSKKNYEVINVDIKNKISKNIFYKSDITKPTKFK